ncbi:MAG TPA: hypothetical protein VD761_10835 [Solirubrobacterales bacterium]|nr:hypothetical protein [Solirubrobacterales bacterium]
MLLRQDGSSARSGGLFLTCLCLLVACAMLAAPSGSAAAGRPLTTGISYLHVDDFAPVAFDHVKATGSRLVLTPVEWGHIVPEERPANWQPDNPADPNYDWDAYDQWVRNAVASGLTPVLQLRGGPRWAQRCHFTSFDQPCDLNPADLAAFSTAAARRYSGNFGGLPRVQYWQGLNEPNLSLFFGPQYVNGKAVSAELYRTLINTVYSAVKAVDPSNLVLLGGLGPIAVPKYTVGPMQFTRELLCMRGGSKKPRPAPGDCGGGVNFDIFDVHPYTTGSPSHEGGPNDVQLGDLQKLQTLIRAADRAGRINSTFKRTPLWITEISWDSKPPDPGGLPFPILNRWTAEMLHTAWSAGISNVFWYSLRDRRPEAGVPFSESLESGLYFSGVSLAEDQPKPNLYAFRFPFVAYPQKKGLSFWGRTPTSAGGKVLIQRKKGKGWRTVRSIKANSVGIFRGTAKTNYGLQKKGYVRARFQGIDSVPFSMKPVPDFYQPPFGKPVG